MKKITERERKKSACKRERGEKKQTMHVIRRVNRYFSQQDISQRCTKCRYSKKKRREKETRSVQYERKTVFTQRAMRSTHWISPKPRYSVLLQSLPLSLSHTHILTHTHSLPRENMIHAQCNFCVWHSEFALSGCNEQNDLTFFVYLFVRLFVHMQ